MYSTVDGHNGCMIQYNRPNPCENMFYVHLEWDHSFGFVVFPAMPLSEWIPLENLHLNCFLLTTQSVMAFDNFVFGHGFCVL